ncbi:TPA: HAMP domain-containing histidine kinase [Candidatus Scatousia excrementigallinarum]|uniref:histidine kinase n=1 Tax=Candidatus Scatousia excrementigallinarum TaxID=2840935 RepID=A0A9D1EYE1_9BACT|nr:HAMP domain-containing histidine kinase [Candidatus Scatousia excrementigallinarum]
MPSELLKEQSRCIAHEIRNQVSICDVYCEIIKKHMNKDGIKNESIDNALDCIQKAVKMINNSLIDLKSLDNIKPSVCSINDLIEQSINLGKVYISDKQITITPNLKSDVQIYADENKFLACMINLIKNAIEAIDSKGEIIITSDIDREYAVIRVSNTGKPISPSSQKELFNEGFTTKKTGSGLGLYICKTNLHLQNAELSLVQSTGKKTEFEIKVPLIGK